jgi:uncharacterized protein
MPNNNPSGHNQYSKRNEQGESSTNPAECDTSSGVMAEAGSIATHSTAASATPAKRGFAAMDEATQRGIASKGGQSQGKDNNPGNFANDRDRAREAGRKGGEAHGQHREGSHSLNG